MKETRHPLAILKNMSNMKYVKLFCGVKILKRLKSTHNKESKKNLLSGYTKY